MTKLNVKDTILDFNFIDRLNNALKWCFLQVHIRMPVTRSVQYKTMNIYDAPVCIAEILLTLSLTKICRHSQPCGITIADNSTNHQGVMIVLCAHECTLTITISTMRLDM